jgi:H+/Cl- antiporter ClcA
MKKIINLFVVNILVGAIVGLVYLVFKTFVEEAQHLLWFELGGVEQNVIMALPLAIAGGFILSWLMHKLNITGHQDTGHGLGNLVNLNINSSLVARTLAVGAASLVLGASLGPEAVLIPVSFGIGYLVAKKLKIDNPQSIGLIAVIALLACFFNTIFAGLLPLGMAMISKKKDTKTLAIVIISGLLATGAAIGVLRLFSQTEGYIYLGVFDNFEMSWTLVAVSIFAGAISTLIPLILDVLIKPLMKFYDSMKFNWVAGGLVAGLGIGLGYAALGPVAFFSGQSGMGELIQNNSEYTALQLVALAVGKLLLTAWSVATIYRGGLIFPQLLAATSITLLILGTNPDAAWLVALLASSFFGVFVGALGSLFIAAVFVFSVFGTQAWFFVIAAAVGSLIVKQIFKDKFTKQEVL